MKPLVVTAHTLVSALGIGGDEHLKAIQRNYCGLRPCSFEDTDLDTWIGMVDAVREERISPALYQYDCRNNRLAQLALRTDGFENKVNHLKQKYGPERIGVFIGTSTSGIHQLEKAIWHMSQGNENLPSDYHYRQTHNYYSVGDFTRRYLGLLGPSHVVSTACSSSAKVFATAARCIETGLCDAALVGGVDSLCSTTLYGFKSLDLISKLPCRPWDANRSGISIGEGAGFALLESQSKTDGDLALYGYGESSDAYHMSRPHPQGLGARLAIEQALANAEISGADIDHVLLHGTGTLANDAAEDLAVRAALGTNVSCSSIKGATGHTLGAAGILNSIICLQALKYSVIPATCNTLAKDPELSVNIALSVTHRPSNYALSNAFGFGGSNCSLIFGKLNT